MINNFAGMHIRIVDAQKQNRTPKNVRGPWVRPKVPNKIMGRKGTRRSWKRNNIPHYIMLCCEPSDVIVFNNIAIVTPLQAHALKRVTLELKSNDFRRIQTNN